MSLRDELPPASRPGPPCRLRQYLDLSDRTSEWEELLADPTIEGTRIWIVLKKHGFEYGENVVQRHRRGMCACR